MSVLSIVTIKRRRIHSKVTCMHIKYKTEFFNMNDSSKEVLFLPMLSVHLFMTNINEKPMD